MPAQVVTAHLDVVGLAELHKGVCVVEVEVGAGRPDGAPLHRILSDGDAALFAGDTAVRLRVAEGRNGECEAGEEAVEAPWACSERAPLTSIDGATKPGSRGRLAAQPCMARIVAAAPNSASRREKCGPLKGMCLPCCLAAKLAGPAQKAEELTLLRPQKAEHDASGDSVCVHAGIGFKPPPQIGAAPWREPVSASGGPKKVERAEHSSASVPD